MKKFLKKKLSQEFLPTLFSVLLLTFLKNYYQYLMAKFFVSFTLKILPCSYFIEVMCLSEHTHRHGFYGMVFHSLSVSSDFLVSTCCL